jgi:hypothetical protein
MYSGLYCMGAAGGQYSAGLAKLYVNDIYVLRGGPVERVRGVLEIEVSTTDLHNSLVVICDDASLARSARCTKLSESLPTTAIAPSVVLENVRSRWL